MPPTDPGIEERVCRKLGWEPRVGDWGVVRKSDNLTVFVAVGGSDEGQRRLCQAYAGDREDVHVIRRPVWPPTSTSWEWAGKALDEARKRGIEIGLTATELGYWAIATKHPDRITGYHHGQESGPLAVAMAIDAALPEPKEKPEGKPAK